MIMIICECLCETHNVVVLDVDVDDIDDVDVVGIPFCVQVSSTTNWSNGVVATAAATATTTRDLRNPKSEGISFFLRSDLPSSVEVDVQLVPLLRVVVNVVPLVFVSKCLSLTTTKKQAKKENEEDWQNFTPFRQEDQHHTLKNLLNIHFYLSMHYPINR